MFKKMINKDDDKLNTQNTMSDESSTQATSDPYDPDKKIRVGKYKRQIVDSSEKRPAEIIEEEADFFIMANFRHKHQFWIAKVPKTAVEEVVVRIDRFPTSVPLVKPAHTLLAFKLKDGSPVQLSPQPSNGGAVQEPTTVDAFYFSVDYMAPKGIEYGLVEGLGKNFLATERFLSVWERGATETYNPDYPSDNLPLALDEETKNQLLEKAIRRSNARRDDDFYNTWEINCTTELFSLLDSEIDYGSRKVKPFKESILHITDPVAGPTHEALKERGIVDQDAPQPDWINK